MSTHEFYLTMMGKRFYESTMPELVNQLKRLNDNLERISDVVSTRANVERGDS